MELVQRAIYIGKKVFFLVLILCNIFLFFIHQQNASSFVIKVLKDVKNRCK